MHEQPNASPRRPARARRAVIAWAGRLPLVLLLATAPLHATPSRGAAEFEICQSCHGLCGEGNEALGAPRLGGLGEAYLARQLAAFRAGHRGAQAADTRGAQMRAMALVLSGPEAVAAVARFAAALPSRPPASGVAGDLAHGRELYGVCAACHGPAGQGEATPGAPRLAGMSDAYQLRQLQAFRSGWRGIAADDPLAASMRAIALSLPDAQALADVIAYVGTFEPPVVDLPAPMDAPAACGR